MACKALFQNPVVLLTPTLGKICVNPVNPCLETKNTQIEIASASDIFIGITKKDGIHLTPVEKQSINQFHVPGQPTSASGITQHKTDSLQDRVGK